MRIDWQLTAEQRADARRALKILGDSATLETAAMAFIAGKRSVERKTVEDVADRFLHTRLTDGLRPASIQWYDERLAFIVDKFGDRMMDSVTRAEFRGWLEGSPWAPASRAGTARAARAMWRWALRTEPPMAAVDVTVGLKFAVTARNGGGSTKFLSVDECAAALRNVAPKYRSALALMLFAGVRPDEIAGKNKPWLQWSHVNVAERIIRIPEGVAKIGEARVMEGLPDAVWAWLTPEKAGPVSPIGRRSLIDNVHAASGLAQWRQDGLRHSFASYAVAMFNDPGRVAMWLGHNGNPTMLHRHYRGLVTKAEAEKFWGLRP